MGWLLKEVLVEELGAGLGSGAGVVEVVEVLVEPGYQSGTSSVLDVELSATELLEAVELELDVLEVDEDELDVDEVELDVDEELLDADEDVLEVLSSGLSSPQPVRSAAAKIPAKNTVFFIKYLLEANILLL